MRKGITLIELLVVFAIMAITIGLSVFYLNPGGQLASARNNQRKSGVNTILNGIRENIADNRTGLFTCSSGDIPSSSKRMATGAGNYDIAGCLIPTYLPILPFDPATSSAHYTSPSDYDTGYYVIKATSTGVITITAPAAELKQTISVSR